MTSCPHGIMYDGLEQCARCRETKSAGPTTSSPRVDTRGLEEMEKEYRDLDGFLRHLACKIFDPSEGMPNERHLAVKMLDNAAKWARLALDIRAERLEIQHDQWLVEQKRMLDGG